MSEDERRHLVDALFRAILNGGDVEEERSKNNSV